MCFTKVEYVFEKKKKDRKKKNLPNQSKAMYSADEDSIGTYIE